MRVVMIGTGNVATVLSKLLVLKGHEIIQVYGRNPDHASSLAKEVQTKSCSDPREIDQSADLYIVALSDTALYSISSWFKPGNKLVVHTAGSVPMEVLKGTSSNYGVLYPLQSLRKEMESFPEIPFLIEGNTPDDLCLIEELAADLSGKVVKMNSDDRMRLHIGAVLVSNFTNYLYTRTAEYYKDQQLDFRLLLPLMKESVNRLEHYDPVQLQTGPAVRDDQTTIQKHLQLLSGKKDLADLYHRFSEEIREYFAKPKSGK
jgi:predicted short-subunit dehydrogenase-like oxidoreductase (DUF2520 family)